MSEEIIVTRKTNVLLQYGALAAGTSLLFFVILYLMGSESFTSPLAWVSMLAPIVFAVLACLRARKENGGFLEFREALKICFGILVITTLASSLFSYVLFNFIDPAFADSMKQLTMEQTQKFMQRFNVPQEAADKALEQILNTNLYSLGNILKSFAQACIGYFIVALILAAILKKKKPFFPS